MMKLKVCGMRDAENISELIKLNPDYMGFIFYQKSKRFVITFPEVEIPSEIKKVGVFVNEDIDKVLEITKQYRLEAIQLHGDETPEYINELRNKICYSERSEESIGIEILGFNQKDNSIEIFKAFSVDDNFDFSKTEPYQKVCNFLLFDTKGKEYGGNGIKFNWEVLQKYKGKIPFLLSGGITKNDTLEIKKIKHPAFAGLDINSGFEIEPALKKIEDIKEFKQNL